MLSFLSTQELSVLRIFVNMPPKSSIVQEHTSSLGEVLNMLSFLSTQELSVVIDTAHSIRSNRGPRRANSKPDPRGPGSKPKAGKQDSKLKISPVAKAKKIDTLLDLLKGKEDVPKNLHIAAIELKDLETEKFQGLTPTVRATLQKKIEARELQQKNTNLYRKFKLCIIQKELEKEKNQFLKHSGSTFKQYQIPKLFSEVQARFKPDELIDLLKKVKRRGDSVIKPTEVKDQNSCPPILIEYCLVTDAWLFLKSHVAPQPLEKLPAGKSSQEEQSQA
jgi:hypothetical protein